MWMLMGFGYSMWYQSYPKGQCGYQYGIQWDLGVWSTIWYLAEKSENGVYPKNEILVEAYSMFINVQKTTVFWSLYLFVREDN
jgi:hypothetical protein